MFNVEDMAAKFTTNKRTVQIYTFDRGGNEVMRQRVGYGDTDLWPIRYAEQIDEILTHGKTGHSYPLSLPKTTGAIHYVKVHAS